MSSKNVTPERRGRRRSHYPSPRLPALGTPTELGDGGRTNQPFPALLLPAPALTLIVKLSPALSNMLSLSSKTKVINVCLRHGLL